MENLLTFGSNFWHACRFTYCNSRHKIKSTSNCHADTGSQLLKVKICLCVFNLYFWIGWNQIYLQNECVGTMLNSSRRISLESQRWLKGRSPGLMLAGSPQSTGVQEIGALLWNWLIWCNLILSLFQKLISRKQTNTEAVHKNIISLRQD